MTRDGWRVKGRMVDMSSRRVRAALLKRQGSVQMVQCFGNDPSEGQRSINSQKVCM